MIALLTDKERRRFIEWLTMEASTSRDIIIQMEKLKVPDAVVANEKQWMKSCIVVLDRISRTESTTIGGD